MHEGSDSSRHAGLSEDGGTSGLEFGSGSVRLVRRASPVDQAPCTAGGADGATGVSVSDFVVGYAIRP